MLSRQFLTGSPFQFLKANKMVRQWAIIICILGFSALVVPLLSSAQIILLIGAILAVVPIRMLPAHPGMVLLP